jgi:hypothetical protein
MFSVPVIKFIGLGVGILVWGSANLMTGWLCGMVPLFGLADESKNVKVPWLNYLGVALALTSLGIYFFVKSEGAVKKEEAGNPAGYAPIRYTAPYIQLYSLADRIYVCCTVRTRPTRRRTMIPMQLFHQWQLYARHPVELLRASGCPMFLST